MNLVPNTFVAFYHEGELNIGKIAEFQDNQYLVNTISGQALWLSASRFVLKASQPSDQALAGFTTQVAEIKSSLAQHDFSFLQAEALRLEEIARQLSLSTDAQLFGLYDYLKSNPAIFSQKKELFRLKTASEAEEFLRQQQADISRKHFLHEIEVFEAGKELNPQIQHQLYQELPFAHSERKYRDLMAVIHNKHPQLSAEQALIAFRKSCGELPGIIDPIIALSALPVGFSALQQKEKLVGVDKDATIYTTAFCIDDEDTKDYDDAISLEKDNGVLRLGIHVSCVADRLPVDGLLMQEAERRTSSLYTANFVVPMFPTQYSETELSLINSVGRNCLSQYFWLDESYQILRKELRRDTIKVSANLSYRQVDKSINQEPFITLNRICKKLETARAGAGENKDKRSYYSVKEQHDKLILKQVNPNSPARKMVEELMILYNSSMAAYANENAIPIIYRNVTQFATATEDFPASQAYLSTAAKFHPGIGTSAYLHASSPIRRWIDLVNQLQVVSALRLQTPIYSAAQLEQMIEIVEKKLNYINETGRLSERYWWLKYIEQSLLHTPLEAQFCGANKGHLRLELLQWGVQVLAKCDAYPSQEQFTIVFYKVDWDEGILFGDIL